MPFDVTQLSPATQTLLDGRQRIEAGWCQRTARTPDERVCAIGAIAWEPHYEAAVPFLIAAVGVPGAVDIGQWNDTRDRTQADVLAAYDRAIALSRINDEPETRRRVFDDGVIIEGPEA